MESDKDRLGSADSGKKRDDKKLPSCCGRATKLEIGLVVATFVLYIIHLIIVLSYSYFATVVNNRDAAREADAGINPPPWAFSIWAFIYTWALIFVSYSIASLFPSTGLHRPHIGVYPAFMANNLCGVFWFVSTERYAYWPGTIFITGLPITLYIALFFSVYGMRKHGLNTHYDSRKFYLYTYLVDNAIALYMGWVSVAYLLYFGETLVYGVGLDFTNVGTGLLSWLLIKLSILLSLEVTLMDKYMRHIWAHYLALINAVGGSILANFDPANRNSTITVCAAGALGVAFMVKILRIIGGKCGRPEYDGRVTPAPSAPEAFVEVVPEKNEPA